MADQVLHPASRAITDLMVKPGLINLDFADVRVGHARDGQGDDGHRRGAGEEPGARGRRSGDLQSAARRDR